jgi:hypothetical protein
MSYKPYKYTDVIVEVKGQIGYVRVRSFNSGGLYF